MLISKKCLQLFYTVSCKHFLKMSSAARKLELIIKMIMSQNFIFYPFPPQN